MVQTLAHGSPPNHLVGEAAIDEELDGPTKN